MRPTLFLLPSGAFALTGPVQPIAYIKPNTPTAFKMAVKKAGGRWYLYAGGEGFSVIDVTDPAKPRNLRHVSMPNGNQLTLHDNLLIAGMARPTHPGPHPTLDDPYWPEDFEKPWADEGVILWDISTPDDPKKLSTWNTGGGGTHRNGYPGGKYAFLSAYMKGYFNSILEILDVSDPLHPKSAGHWWQPGQADGETPTPAPHGFHGPPALLEDGKTLIAGYTPGLVNLDISDPSHPRVIGSLKFAPPFISAGSQSIHTAVPLGHGLVHVSSEAAFPGCKDNGMNFAAIVDDKDLQHPKLMSLYPLPLPPPGAPYKSFCNKGGRFGPHNVVTEIHLPDVEKPSTLVYMTYFTAGLRIFDIVDPRQPTETGWFLPDVPEWKGSASGKLGSRGAEDVIVDTRGIIYMSDGNGVWLLRYTGPDKPPPTDR